jgi:hypothetical protein
MNCSTGSQDSGWWPENAAVFAVQAVIRPAETRDYLIRMLDVHRMRSSGGVGRHRLSAWPTSY